MRFFRHSLVVALVAGVCGCGMIGGNTSDEGGRSHTSHSTGGDGSKNGTAVAANTDPLKLYLDSLRQQALQPSINLVHEYYRSREAYPEGSYRAVVAGFDYRTKNVRFEDSELRLKDGKITLGWTTWCQGKSQLWFRSSVGHWSLKGDQCPSLTSQVWVNDGMGVGGLTPEQADLFITRLTSYKGLINATEKSIVERFGKKYVRLEVTVTPHQYGPSDDSFTMGANAFMDAVKNTDIDLATHPYDLLPSGDAALHIVRYIDPQTLLPVYSETQETLEDEWKMHRVEYSFGGPVQARPRPATPEIARMTWPREGH